MDKHSIVTAIYIAVVGVVMSAIIAIFSVKHGTEKYIILVALILCIALVIFGVVVIKKKSNLDYSNSSLNNLDTRIETEKNFLKTLIAFSVITIATSVLAVYLLHTFESSKKDSDISADIDIPIASDIPIIVDISFHSTHERPENNLPSEQAPQAVIDMSEKSFVEYMQANVGGNIWRKFYQNYEGNRERQMFAVVEKISDYSKSNEENGYGTLWYIDQYGAKEVDKEAKEYSYNHTCFLQNGYVFLILRQYRPTGNIAYIWSVLDGEPYQLAISGQGSDIRINESGDVEVVVLEKVPAYAEDGSRMEKHEEMVYYFYFDDTNTLREYGGVEIRIGELQDIFDTQDISTIEDIIQGIYSKTAFIDEIYYRENGIIHINISKEDGVEVRHYSVTVKYDGTEWQIVPAENGQVYSVGIYREALIPSIATYPDEIPF